MSARPARLVFLALLLAAALGAAVGGMSRLSAVSSGDPRPSNGPLSTLVPIPTPTPTPPPAASSSATTTPSLSPEPQADVWLYAVQVGDSMSGIAIRFGTTTQQLLTLNPEYQANENLIEVGAQVIVPCTPIAAAEDRC